jgi:hypothetical protein
MRILSVAPDVRERIEVEGGEWSTYYRYGPDAWFVVMGEAEEPLFQCGEIEALYQRGKNAL